MATAAYILESLPAQRSAERMAPIAVIADDGEAARVVSVLLAAPPRLGDRFQFEGKIWEIVRLKDAKRGFVARPVALLR